MREFPGAIACNEHHTKTGVRTARSVGGSQFLNGGCLDGRLLSQVTGHVYHQFGVHIIIPMCKTNQNQMRYSVGLSFHFGRHGTAISMSAFVGAWCFSDHGVGVRGS